MGRILKGLAKGQTLLGGSLLKGTGTVQSGTFGKSQKQTTKSVAEEAAIQSGSICTSWAAGSEDASAPLRAKTNRHQRRLRGSDDGEAMNDCGGRASDEWEDDRQVGNGRRDAQGLGKLEVQSPYCKLSLQKQFRGGATPGSGIAQ